MAEQKAIRGSVTKQEVRDENIVRDTRGSISRFIDWIKIPANMMIFVFVFGIIAFMYPGIADICLVVSLLCTWFALTRYEKAPLKLPIQSGLSDSNERHPATGLPQDSAGIFFIGNELRTGKEVWLTNSDCRQHFLVLGTTGAGKTETLIGFAANAVSWGSGFLFCDGKGDVALYAKIYALARRFGREDDLLVLNYMTGNSEVGLSYGEKRSNTLNPFATGSSDGLTQMVVGLMDDVGGDGAMWKGRATAMFTGVMRALTWLRDQNLIDLNVSEIRDYLQLKRIMDLASPEQYEQMPPSIRHSINSYLTSLPGYKEAQGYAQSQTTLDQHGYLEMQFTKILGSLADVYGYIFKTPYAEVDMADVVLNRRILVIMLPALEKSKDEIANLGKIVVATLKGMMGGTLGNKLEGQWEDIVENRPTNSPSPFICILDEVGYYMVDGMELMAAQARSLGFSMVFAGQDINAMKRLNEKVFGSVQGNTNTKVVMRTEDPDTAKIAIDAGGKTYRAHLGGYSGAPSEMGGKMYSDNMEARLEAIDRVNPRDLKDQDEGEMHIFHKDWLVRAKGFYAAPESTLNKRGLKLRPNHFITVAKPNRESLENQQRLPDIVELLISPSFAETMKTAEQNAQINLNAPSEIVTVHNLYAAIARNKGKTPSPVEAACSAFARMIEVSQGITDNHNDDIRSRAGAGIRDNDYDPFAPSGMAEFEGMEDSHHDIAARRDKMSARDGFMAPPDLDDEPMGRRADDRSGITQSSLPFKQPKFKKDVPHGVDFEGDGIQEMASRISNNEAVMNALASLDYDEYEQDADTLDSEIEEAIDLSNKEEKGVWGSATANDISEASVASSLAVPDFDEFVDDSDDEEVVDAGDEGSSDNAVGIEGGSLTADLLSMLIDGDEDEE